MKAKGLLALLMAAALEISSFGVGGTVQAAGIPVETQTALEQSAEEQPETQAALEQSVEVQSETQTDPEHEESLGDEIKVSVQTQISETDSSGFTYEMKETGITITGYEGTDTVLNIPAQINGLNVMTIGEKAFSNKATITKVTIPETVTSVGYAAFQNCTGLKELVINAKQLKDGPSVNSISSSSNYDGNKSIFYNAGSSSGFIITFGEGVTRVPADFFSTAHSDSDGVYCKVSKVVLSSTVKTIGDYAFAHCGALKEIEGGSSVESVGNGAFYNTGFEKVVILPAMNTLGEKAYYECANLETVDINADNNGELTTIGSLAFANCPRLKSVSIGGKVSAIQDEAFTGDKALKSVKLYSPVATLGARAFVDDVALSEVELPATLISLGNGAFRNCTGLTDMVINAKKLGDGPSVNSVGYSDNYDGNAAIFYNAGSPTGFTVTFGMNVTKIPANLFSTAQDEGSAVYCRVNKVVAMGYVEEVGNSAFARCYGLEQITFHGNAPKTFGENCFYGNTTTVQYPQTNKTWKADVQQDYGGTITWQAADIIDNGGSSGGSDTPTPVIPSGQSVVVVGQKLDLKTLLPGCDSYQMNVKGMAAIKHGVLTAKKATGTKEFVVTGLKTENGKKVPGTAISVIIEKPVASAKTISATRKDQTINGVENITGTTLKPTRWVSSKPAIVSVDEKTGVLTAQTKGVSVITAYYGEGTMAGKCTFKVKVSIPYFSKASGTKVTGAKFKLKLSGVPKDKTVTWASKDTKAAAVDAAGMVTVNEVSGSPVILTGTVDGVAYEYALSITEPQLKKTVYTLKVNKKVKIALKNTKIKITSLTADQVKVSNPSVAAFDTATGKVTALAAGSTNITLTVGGKDLTFSVTVQ